MRNLEEFNDKHRGQRCVILASGPSICDNDLSDLSGLVTIAVNSGYVAYESDYFVSDDWEVVKWSYFDQNLKDSQKTIALLYEDKLAKVASAFGDRTVLFRHRTGYHITDKYSHSDKENHIMQCRSSVGSAIHIAHIMGCAEILVLGIDCCRSGNHRWFWQLPAWESKPYRLDKKKIDKYHRRRSLKVSTDSDLVDILRYWKDQGVHINKKCKVYNGSDKSLVTIFPHKGLNEFKHAREYSSGDSSEGRIQDHTT